MKRLIAALVLLAFATPTMGQVQVNGYVKKDGTYVSPHVRSSPNSTTLDNYSTKGNVNPYTGEKGTKDPYPTPDYRLTTPRSYTPSTPTYRPYSSPSPPSTTYEAPCYFNCSD